MPSKILFVGNDPNTIRALQTGLKKDGFSVLSVEDGNEALSAIADQRPELVILDMSVEVPGGMDMCRKIRADSSVGGIPIIAVSDQNEHDDRVQVLNAGADDYLVKPVHMDELVARIRAVQRRTGSGPEDNIIRAGLIEMDPERWMVNVDGKPVTLTPKEFGLLRILLEARGRVLTREYLLESVWSHATSHGLDTRTVDVHVWRLRRKLGPAGRYIITVRNVGYRIEIFLEWSNLNAE